jgi:hypothetical protein
MMADGKAQTFGPKDEVLNKVLRRPAGPAAAGQSSAGGGTLLKVVETQGAKA